MESNIKNFSELERLIKTDPKRADTKAYEWQQFLKSNIESFPELGSIESSEEFYKWAREHPEKNINTGVWVGKEITDAYSHLREGYEDVQMQDTGEIDRTKVNPDLLGTPLLALAYFQKPKIMEEDRDFQKIEEKLKKEWLKNNPGKDLYSQEGLDYTYGSLNERGRSTLHQEAEKRFRENPKFKTRLERYDKEKTKIYKKSETDPHVVFHKRRAQEETQARLALLNRRERKTTPVPISKEEKQSYEKQLVEKIHRRHLIEFAQNYPEKTKTYHERIKLQKTAKTEPLRPISFQSPGVNKFFNRLRVGSPRLNSFSNLGKFFRSGFNPLRSLFGPGAMVKRGFLMFLTSSGFPVLIALIIITVLTFVIVSFGGIPLSEPPDAGS